ncbi:hypothetical protein IWQ60_002293 [Tieghemiomyces parasiticus]|uniref:Rhomboid-type serine protease n=1 Tax=Tieghemiomyces parasiticus TaxID=78921 RepID=A0A9W8AJQ8_9FUNG|nr:hypothetical protein IWQ60_002293 [Tieghemiomyces parasiticus]
MAHANGGGPYHTEFTHSATREFPEPNDGITVHSSQAGFHDPLGSPGSQPHRNLLGSPGSPLPNDPFYPPRSHITADHDSAYSSVYTGNPSFHHGNVDSTAHLGYTTDKHGGPTPPHIPMVDLKGHDGGPLSPPHQTGPPPRGFQRVFARRRPWVVYAFTLAQIIALIIEIVTNKQLTGSAIQTDPFNYMIGPSVTTLIRNGARFVPCMRPGSYSSQPAPCPDSGGIYTANSTCTWEDLCGFNGFSGDGTPNQGFRFVLPIFLHAGVVHLLFNLLSQLSYGAQLEREIGWWRFGCIYILSGIGGLVLGSILSPPLFASVGASGALMGLFACQLLEILFHWHLIHNPTLELFKFIIAIGLTFVLGLLPGIDNFAHIGGFIAGLFAGLIFLSNLPFDKYTRTIRIISWVISVAVIITLFTAGLVTFYNGTDPEDICSWCKNLTCAAIFDSCKAMYK